MVEQSEKSNGASCIFCKIIKGEIPSEKVYEDNDVFAFLDITPIHPGHTLVVPKKHTENIYSFPEKDLQKVVLIAKKIAGAIKSGLGAPGLDIHMNNGKPGGQVIFHAHFHVIPRFENDGYEHWHGKRGIPNEALRDAAEKIKKNI